MWNCHHSVRLKISYSLKTDSMYGIYSHSKSYTYLQLPPTRDFPKWNNRIIANLLYYQTNYFTFMGICILLATLFSAQVSC